MPLRNAASAARRGRTAPTFAAIDFETANRYRDSVCAFALVRVEHGRVVERFSTLVRPPTRRFELTHVHGLTARDVAKAPRFAEAWAAAKPLLRGVRFLAAHHAAFDRSVLHRSCERFGVRPPRVPFRCTVQLARRCWRLPSARLPVVAAHLGLALEHHDPASDAEVCAQIVLRALGEGARI